MKVTMAPSAGFCRGVKKAVYEAKLIAAKNDEPVYTDGPLIHNRQMMAELSKAGVNETDNPGELKGKTLIIRAHGIPPERRAWLKQLDLNLFDATCPDVARIQALIRKHVRQGAQIVIFGDKGHSEVVGLLGYAEGHGYVVETIEDIEQLPRLHKVCMVAQSTQLPAHYQQMADVLRQRFPNLIVLDTICESTRRRQSEIEELAKECDVIVVVGGHHSANTVRLVKLAQSLRPTIHIETSAELNAGMFDGYQHVALTGGASTPDHILQEVKSWIEKI